MSKAFIQSGLPEKVPAELHWLAVIFAATGREDIAYPNLTPQIEAMKAYPEIFDFSEDISGGNFHYIVKENSVHAYEEVYHHVWNYIPYFLFK